ncbi:hypothetical protein FOZ60_000436 [Perkinsus olseni]|uniref:Uncharacterized protein n=1 Tax=Perkinsus olseni TaxID=32597 RepID=A0A7J6P3H1_PEROL|nr:hypothetical protein FOZ60_000436 [Perkinsus olseni]
MTSVLLGIAVAFLCSLPSYARNQECVNGHYEHVPREVWTSQPLGYPPPIKALQFGNNTQEDCSVTLIFPKAGGGLSEVTTTYTINDKSYGSSMTLHPDTKAPNDAEGSKYVSGDTLQSFDYYPLDEVIFIYWTDNYSAYWLARGGS